MTIPVELIVTDFPDHPEYHLGKCWSGPAVNLGPYVTNAGTQVPGHWWNAVFYDRKTPIVIKRSPADIIAANRMFPFGDTGCKVANVTAPPYTPMGSSSITIYEPTTGERPDIGLVTDASGHFMRTGDGDAMLAWAQAAASCPMHFRDENTGKPINLLTYPKANCYQGNQGSPQLDPGPPIPATGTVYLPDGVTLDPTAPGYDRGSNGYHVFGGGWTPQQAHEPELSYVAHVATGDLGFLKDLQYVTNFTTGICDASQSTPTKTITSGELRGLSWAFRNLFMAHAATLDAEKSGTLPASCHPSSYWKTLLDNQLAYYTTTYMADPANQAFRLVSGGNRFGPWQADYMLSALAFGILTGHLDWAPLYLWALKNVIDRTSGKSGYPPGWGGAYYLNTFEWKKNPDGTYDQNQFDATKPLDWYGSFLFLVNDPNSTPPTPAQIATLKIDPLNGGKSMAGGEYLMTTRAVLVYAQYLHKLGLVDVKSVYPDLDLCFTNVDRMVRAGGSINPRDSVVLDASQAPTTIPPLPPVIPPTNPQPPTEITMSNTTLRVGETKHVTLAVTPPDADQTGLTYTASPDGLVTLAPDASGVAITRHAQGVATITASLNSLTATAEADDAAPLATALALSWDS